MGTRKGVSLLSAFLSMYFEDVKYLLIKKSFENPVKEIVFFNLCVILPNKEMSLRERNAFFFFLFLKMIIKGN